MKILVVLLMLAVVRVQGQALPAIPSDFRVSEELTSNGVTSYIKDVVYSDTHQAIRYERRASKPEPASFYSTEPLVSIHDYNVGVSFTINKVRRNCTISPISVLTFDSQWNFTNSLVNVEEAYGIRLKSPKAFFQLDHDYTYSGEDSVSGVPSKVFTSEYSQNTSQGMVKVNNAFAFSGDNIVFQQTGMDARNIPMRLKTLQENKPEASSHFYDFDQIDDIRWFDVSQCFSDIDLSIENATDIIDFIVRFPVTGGSLILPDEKTLVTIGIQTLVKFTNESFTRFSRPRLSVSEEGILYLRSSVLPQPPPLSYFTKLDGYWLVSSPTISSASSNNTEECAARCMRNILCLSFDWSNNTKSCYLNKKHSLDTSASSLNGLFHHSRNTLNGFYSRHSFDIMNLFKQGIQNNTFSITIGGMTLFAKSIDQVEDDANIRFGTTQLLSRYDMTYPNKKYTTAKDRTIAKTNIDDCARACNDEPSFDCQSFDFCYTSGDCRLSKSGITSESNELITTVECDVYEKNPLYHYTRYPSKSFTDERDLKYTPVNSPSECATKCDDETSLHCRSFNYCPDQKVCYLSTNHAIDSTENTSPNPALTCTHYSRDYLADFTLTSTGTIPLEGEVVYDGITLDSCTLMCVTADGFSCKTIDYCPETKKCLLHSSNAQTPSQSSSAQKDLCYSYKRDYFFTSSVQANGGKKGASTDNSDVLFGVAISMGVVALLAGSIAMFMYLKKKSKL